MNDERAIKLLSKACWSSAGWKSETDLSSEEIEYLEAAGYAPPERTLTHDACAAWALSVCSRIVREHVCSAFVWSLDTRHLEYRSALGSYAYLHQMPDHPFTCADAFNEDICSICGSNEQVSLTQRDFIDLNFERHKWGGVRHDELSFMAYDLEMFYRLPPVNPSKAGWDALASILEAAADASTGRTVGSLKKAIRSIVRSNDAEADGICHILSYAGILASDKHRGFDGRFVPFDERDDARPRSDQKYPLNCWKGSSYQREAVRYWFPQIDS